MDIEGYELDALPEWIESGVLEKVLFAFLSSLFPVGVLEKFFFWFFFPRCFQLPLSFRWTRWPLNFIWGEYMTRKSKLAINFNNQFNSLMF